MLGLWRGGGHQAVPSQRPIIQLEGIENSLPTDGKESAEIIFNETPITKTRPPIEFIRHRRVHQTLDN